MCDYFCDVKALVLSNNSIVVGHVPCPMPLGPMAGTVITDYVVYIYCYCTIWPWLTMTTQCRMQVSQPNSSIAIKVHPSCASIHLHCYFDWFRNAWRLVEISAISHAFASEDTLPGEAKK